MGAIVFDELERSRSHILVEQLERYFGRTVPGRQRAGRIIPEPFFVHSDLTTGIQLADLVAYVLSWGFRTPKLMAERREELDGLVRQVCELRHRATRSKMGRADFTVWSIAVLAHLRARSSDYQRKRQCSAGRHKASAMQSRTSYPSTQQKPA